MGASSVEGGLKDPKCYDRQKGQKLSIVKDFGNAIEGQDEKKSLKHKTCEKFVSIWRLRQFQEIAAFEYSTATAARKAIGV